MEVGTQIVMVLKTSMHLTDFSSAEKPRLVTVDKGRYKVRRIKNPLPLGLLGLDGPWLALAGRKLGASEHWLRRQTRKVEIKEHSPEKNSERR